MNQVYLGAFAVIGAALLWSLDGLLRQQLYSLPPSVVVFWEHVVGLIVLLPFIVASFRGFRTIQRKQWWAIALVSLLSGALGTIFYTAALGKIQYIQFSVVVLLQQLQPLFAIGAAALLLREPLSRRFLITAIIALGAAYFVSFPTLHVAITPTGTLIAAVLAIGAAASWGSSTAFSKYALRDASFLHITASRFALTPLFAFVFIVFLGQTGSMTMLTATQWKYIVAITFSTGLVALAIYYFGLKRIPASRSTILELTWPLSAMVIGFLMGDRLTMTQWLGAVVLLVSMWSVTREAKRLPEKDLTKI